MKDQRICVGKMRELLAELPDGFVLSCNGLGDIRIQDALDEYHGWLDLEAEVINHIICDKRS